MAQSDEDKSFFVNEMLGAYLKKKFADAKEAIAWAESKGINGSTMRDVYYKNGRCGREVFNQIITELFDITPDKAAAIINQVKEAPPISESQQIWNSIDASELTKRRLALVASATHEIEKSLKDK